MLLSLRGMGTLPDGTLCAYCGVREAGYIPDGCAGPLCMDPDDVCCFDLWQSRGWEYVCGLRYERWKAARFGTLAKSVPRPLEAISQAVAEFSVDVNGSSVFVGGSWRKASAAETSATVAGAAQPASSSHVE